MTLASLALALALTVTPSFIQTGWQEVRFDITLPKTGWVCTGWRYPVSQWFTDQWPYRKSCRQADSLRFEETWGGPKYPFPYVGEYVAFVEFEGQRITRPFRVINTPPGQ